MQYAQYAVICMPGFDVTMHVPHVLWVQYKVQYLVLKLTPQLLKTDHEAIQCNWQRV